jgi:hypothetical protein
MTTKHQTLIAGEALEELIAVVRRMPITAIDGNRAHLSLDLDGPQNAAWIRASERYAADLLVAGCGLTWTERLNQGAQRVMDEVAAAIHKVADDH